MATATVSGTTGEVPIKLQEAFSHVEALHALLADLTSQYDKMRITGDGAGIAHFPSSRRLSGVSFGQVTEVGISEIEEDVATKAGTSSRAASKGILSQKGDELLRSNSRSHSFNSALQRNSGTVALSDIESTGSLRATRSESDGLMRPHEVYRNGFARARGQVQPVRMGSSLKLQEERKRTVIINTPSSQKVGPGRKHGWQALHPDSLSMTLWELLGVLAIMWDCWAIPWFVAFHSIRDDEAVYYVTYVPRAYWTLNVLLNFCTGYYTPEHSLERRFRVVSARYLKTWFSFDVLFVTIDGLAAWLAHPQSTVTSPGVAKAVLVLVGVRIVRQGQRLDDIRQKVAMIRWRNGIRGKSAVTKIGGLVVFIILFNHVVCCLWYWMLQLEAVSGEHTNWLEEHAVDGRGRSYIYFTSLHWSLTQVLPGSMEVVPTNLIERFFNVVVLVFGWVVVVTSTAILTSLMTQKRLQLEQENSRALQLQKYLHQEKVEHALAMRIKREVKAQALQRTMATVKKDDVQDLALLTTSLQKELSVAIHLHPLQENSFLSVLGAFSEQVMTTLCHTLNAVYCRQDHTVFDEGSKGDSMQYIKHGTLKYHRPDKMLGLSSSIAERARSSEGDNDASQFLRACWCAEVALFCEWTHLGTLVSVESAELLVLQAESFLACLKRHTEVLLVACEFCLSVVRSYNDGSTSRAWSDLELAVDYADVLGGTPRDVRVSVADVLLEQWKQRSHEHWHFSKRHGTQEAPVQALQKEIGEGKCFVWLQKEEVFRFVSLVVLRVRRQSDSRFLAKLGEISPDGSVSKAACELPGLKRKEQEVAMNAVERFISQNLPELKSALHMRTDHPAEQTANTQESATYGFRTRYLRTTFNALLDPPTALPSLPVSTLPICSTGGGIKKLLSRRSGGSRTSPEEPSSGGRPRVHKQSSITSQIWKRKRPSINHLDGHTAQDVLVPEDFLDDTLDVVILPRREDGTRIYVWVSDMEFDALQPLRGSLTLQNFLGDIFAQQGKSQALETLTWSDGAASETSAGDRMTFV